MEEKAIDANYVLRLEHDSEGTRIEMPTDEEKALVASGLSVADVMLPKVHPAKAHQMELF